MVTHMKTTIDIADALFERAKAIAERDRVTFRALVEEGLHAVLDRRASGAAPFRLRDASVAGNGLQPDVDLGNRDQLLALIYEGRGA
jgi:predicted DNA-binding ribbon-helix-helix protein